MKEQEKILGFALLTLILMSWLSFALHTDARFAGSLYGGLLGIVATLLFLSTFLYVAIKRIPWLKRLTLRVVSMGTVLRFHIYAGIFGSILALMHTGHKFQSPLGIALTAVMLGVVFSGFVGRYLMSFISEETREKKTNLSKLEQRYREVVVSLAANPEREKVVRSLTKVFFLRWLPGTSPDIHVAREAHDLSESIADLEYALHSHAAIKVIFGLWVKFHIFLSGVLVILLAMHIWSSFYFGVRWLQ